MKNIIIIMIIFGAFMAEANNVVNEIYREGQRKYIMRDYRGAVRDFEKAYTLDKWNKNIKIMYSQALIKLGDEYYGKRDLAMAKKLYTRAFLLDTGELIKRRIASINEINDFISIEKRKNEDRLSEIIFMVLGILSLISLVLLFVVFAIKRMGRGQRNDIIIDNTIDYESQFLKKINEYHETDKLLDRGIIPWNYLQNYLSSMDYSMKIRLFDLVEKNLSSCDASDLALNIKILYTMARDEDEILSNRSRDFSIDLFERSESDTLSGGFALNISKMIDFKCGRLGHSERISRIAFEMAKRINDPHLPPVAARKAGLLHDIGLIETSWEIIQEEKEAYSKLGISNQFQFLKERFEFIEQHPERTIELMNYIDVPEIITEGIRFHHERIDGSGYPFGLKGDKIPLLSQILSLCEYYEYLLMQLSTDASTVKENSFSILHDKGGSLFSREHVNLLISIEEKTENHVDGMLSAYDGFVVRQL